MNYLKEFCTKLQNLDRSKNVATVFKDFLTLSTCSIAQPFYKSDKLEQRYLETIKQYSKEQANEFPQLLAFLIEALKEKYQDFLGQVYMKLNLGNGANGQFFTPYHVNQLMSEINFSESKNILLNNEILTLSEPCCGSGGIIIAFAETMKKHDFNYQKQLFVEAIDIDENCFMMAYLQLSLLGIPARVILGDTIAYKFKEILYTPLYFINNFEHKLQVKQEDKSEIYSNFIADKNGQLKLFDTTEPENYWQY